MDSALNRVLCCRISASHVYAGDPVGVRLCSFPQTNLHPLELFIGAEGSRRDTFDYILLQTAKREKKR